MKSISKKKKSWLAEFHNWNNFPFRKLLITTDFLRFPWKPDQIQKNKTPNTRSGQPNQRCKSDGYTDPDGLYGPLSLKRKALSVLFIRNISQPVLSADFQHPFNRNSSFFQQVLPTSQFPAFHIPYRDKVFPVYSVSYTDNHYRHNLFPAEQE